MNRQHAFSLEKFTRVQVRNQFYLLQVFRRPQTLSNVNWLIGLIEKSKKIIKTH